MCCLQRQQICVLSVQTTDLLSAQTTGLLSVHTTDLLSKMFFGTNRVQNRAFDASPGWFCMKFQRASFLYNHIFQKSSNSNDSAPDQSSGRVDAGIRHGIAIWTRKTSPGAWGPNFQKKSVLGLALGSFLGIEMYRI